jgi:cysteine synthase
MSRTLNNENDDRLGTRTLVKAAPESGLGGRASEKTVAYFRDRQVILPTFRQLANPREIPRSILEKLSGIGPIEPHALNLFRVHWHNGMGKAAPVTVPEYLELPSQLTGVPARIIVALGNRFPLIGAHKVLPAYACLVPLVVNGHFDPTTHRAVWPSTGNYCRGGVAISRIMGCHGVAILPEGMSRERFEWLERWVLSPADIIRTPGSESNVKEIFDKCAELGEDPHNVVLNQFREYGNYLAHYLCTGAALAQVFEAIKAEDPRAKARAFVAASGSAGTLGAGDFLKERYGVRIVAVESLECPTLLENGFGSHNIQGIGDKHVPLIHNAMNTDIVAAVSDRATDRLNLLFNTPVGRSYLVGRRDVSKAVVAELSSLGLSSICNVVAAIKTARYLDLDETDVVLTVATDGADLYATELDKTLAAAFGSNFDSTNAGEVFGECIAGASTADMIELTERERRRVFNLGYYTWVEQQGISVHDFEARRNQAFWKNLQSQLPVWDEMIIEFNRRTGLDRGLN